MATLLPNGRQQFFDANGNPLAGGTVAFFIPNTTTPKDTWQDSGGTILNTNPAVLDAAGEAIIYGSGVYRQIVKDAGGNLVWDQITADTATGGLAWGGTSTGTANAQVIGASSFSQQDGQQISFIAGLTNMGQLTVNGIPVLDDSLSGPTPLVGGEVIAGNAVSLIYEASRGAFHLVSFPIAGIIGQLTDLASATTTDIGSIASQNVNITGSTTITSFGSSASVSFPIYRVTFGSTLTLTQSANLILPGNASFNTVAGATGTAIYAGSGVWRLAEYNAPGAAPIVPILNGQLTWTSSTVVTLLPSKGNIITFPSGLTAKIPSVGIASTVTSAYLNGVATQPLVASTLYYAYLWNQGTQTVPNFVIDWSTTGHATDANSGIEIKSGDATRVLIGMAYPQAGPIFADSASSRLVATWVNRRPRLLSNSFTTTRSTTSGTYVEISSEIRCNLLTWGDAMHADFAGSTFSPSATTGSISTSISVDGAASNQPAQTSNVIGSAVNLPASFGATIAPAEGFHFLTIIGHTSSGNTGQWNVIAGEALLSASVLA